MKREADIIELTDAELSQVSGGSLLGTLLRPTMAAMKAIKAAREAAAAVKAATKQ
jgi:bacteriocin-like protein